MGFHLEKLDTNRFVIDRFMVSRRETRLPLSRDQKLLHAAYLSGQVETGAWQQHLQLDPVLKAHFGDF